MVVIIVFQKLGIQIYLESSFYEYEMVAKMCSCKLSSGQIAYIIGRDVRTTVGRSY